MLFIKLSNIQTTFPNRLISLSALIECIDELYLLINILVKQQLYVTDQFAKILFTTTLCLFVQDSIVNSLFILLLPLSPITDKLS